VTKSVQDNGGEGQYRPATRPIHATAGNHAGPRSKRGFEQYPTPPCTTEALLRKERLPKHVLKPCEGIERAISHVLEVHGHIVTGYDLARDGTDFLKITQLQPDIGAAITNPPFSLAAAIVRHALTLVPKVIVLERIQWLESEERADLFDSGTLARVHVFRNRVPRMHKIDWAGKRSSPVMCLAWYTFEANHKGPPSLHWIRGRAARGGQS
jgi:hypothetical protein